jgi:hypothetical protein
MKLLKTYSYSEFLGLSLKKKNRYLAYWEVPQICGRSAMRKTFAAHCKIHYG